MPRPCDPAHSGGTFPEIRNQVVDQGAPHGAPGFDGHVRAGEPVLHCHLLPAGKYRHLTGFAAAPIRVAGGRISRAVLTRASVLA